jgi:dihydrofolate reductase
MISIIAAYNNNKVIGKDGKIPWSCPEDMKRFRDLTMGCPVIMGRKTWESIGRALPGRTNIVVSKGGGLYPAGVEVAPSFKSAVIGVKETYFCEEVFIIGGEEIYRQALSLADKMYLSHIDDNSDGDTFFPDIDLEEWDVVICESHPQHTFRILERRTK